MELSYLAAKFLELIHVTSLKVFTSATVVVVFMFGDFYNDALLGITILMVMDTILGVSASYVEGTPISSRRFGRAVVKGAIYFMAISAGYFADLTIPFDIIQGTMIAFVGVTEFISILENIGRMGYETPKKLLNQLKEYRDSK
tara:strand:- start:10054 stop:10482 length:429 start_codon:yes stop_codon:yes gene_type:complete